MVTKAHIAMHIILIVKMVLFLVLKFNSLIVLIIETVIYSTKQVSPSLKCIHTHTPHPPL